MDPATHDEWIRKQRTILAVVGLLFGILFLRLFHIQITSAEDYARKSEDNRIEHKRVKAPRGLILDSEANVLAGNRASYTIFLTRSNPKRDAQAVAALEEVIGSSINYSPGGRASRVRLKRDIDFKTVCVVEERLRDEWNLDIEIEPQRNYPYGPLVAHLLGYMGEMQESDLSAPQAKRYETGDYIGKTGIEKVYEDSLRGDDGVRYIEVDALRRIKNDFPYPERDRDPDSGHDLVLTVDLNVQHAAESALPDTLAGSVVALDARSGAVLAMVSNPSFDPNVFVSFQAQEERQRLLQDEREPMLNRSTGGTYPPGSTLKLVAAVAALEAGITDTLSTFEACAGSLAIGDVVFRCANREGHGELNLLEAVEVSCNIYFNHLAEVLGLEAWRQSAEDFGFGQHTGIHLDPGEKRGLLPAKGDYDLWVGGHLMNLVIGQGKMLTTPLQMARYTAALGNGGYLVTPYLSGAPPLLEKVETVSPATLEIVKKAMHRVVHGEKGTGRHVQIRGIEVGGKSGTAQVPNRPDDDAWFIAFAPYQEPEIAVAVVVEAGGPGGTRAGPVARQVIEAYLESSGYDFGDGPTAAVQVSP